MVKEQINGNPTLNKPLNINNSQRQFISVKNQITNAVFANMFPDDVNFDIAIQKLAQVGLKAEVADAYPADLSGGMKKRVGLARAIATNPDIIFFDEPTTGLDPIMADVINDLIVDCVKKLGATALTITHDMNSARKIADRIAMLYNGEIIWVGTVSELDKTDNPYVRQFVAGSAKGPIKMEVKAE